MNAANYTPMAMRTASPSAGDHGVSTDLVHAVLGIADEAWELLDAKTGEHVIEELGDLLWFCALADAATTGDLFTIYADRGAEVEGCTPYDIATAALKLAGLIKKPYAYGKPLPTEAIQAEVFKVIAGVEAIAGRLNITLGEVMELNLLKLKMRFPQRFGCNDAIKRNVKHEAALFIHWQTVLPVLRAAEFWTLTPSEEDATEAAEHLRGHSPSVKTIYLKSDIIRQPAYWLVYAITETEAS